MLTMEYCEIDMMIIL